MDSDDPYAGFMATARQKVGTLEGLGLRLCVSRAAAPPPNVPSLRALLSPQPLLSLLAASARPPALLSTSLTLYLHRAPPASPSPPKPPAPTKNPALQARSRLSKDNPFTVEPSSGVMAPYSRVAVTFSFLPEDVEGTKGFKVLQPESDQTSRNFDFMALVECFG
jgi:hypothetical protein